MASNALRIVMAANFPGDERLGTARVPLRIAAELGRMGVGVSLIFAEDLRRVRAQRADALSAPIRMAVTLAAAAREADIVDIAGFDAWAYARFARLRRPQQTVVSRSNGLWFKALAADGNSQRPSPRQWLGRPYRALFCAWERASIVQSDLTVFGAHPDAEEVIRIGWRTPQNVAVVAPGVDDLFASDVPLDRRRDVAFVGTFFHRKGDDIAVAAMSRVLAARPDVRFTIFGGGVPASSTLARFEPRVRDQVTVAESLSPDQLAARLAHFAVMLLPTRYEGFGLVVLEAMRAGLAVVTTPTGAGLDVLRPEQNGLVVPIEDVAATAAAVLRLVDDEALRLRLATAAVQAARERPWRKTAEDLLNVYERAHAGAARRR